MKKLSKSDQELIRKIAKDWADAFSLVHGFFESTDKASLWMFSPNHLLGDVIPADMIFSGRGKKLVKFIETQLDENTREDGEMITL